jgi:ParB family transcriptional regulator, chromosome partitioning protein
MNDDPNIRLGGPRSTGAGARRTPGLGRGLGALLGESRREEPVAAADGAGAPVGERTPAAGLAMLSIAAIQPNPAQPRRRFDEDALNELANSIAQRGVIQPIIVQHLGEGRYRLVAGERRWRAAQRAQLHEIPALVRELDDREVKALALIENLQREDLNPIEEARAYQALTVDEGLTQAEVAGMIDKSRSHVANLQRLLSLPDGVVNMVEDGRLSMGHARALIGAEDAERLAEAAVARQMSVRDVERLVRNETRGRGLSPRIRTVHPSAEDADIAAMQRQLEELLGLTVRIAPEADPRSGAVTIRYRTLDQLDLICQRLTGATI